MGLRPIRGAGTRSTGTFWGSTRTLASTKVLLTSAARHSTVLSGTYKLQRLHV